jgi:hypothetical protein
VAVQLCLAVAFRVEQLIAVLARLLGLVHGLVGMAQQGVGIGIVLRIQGDADAGTGADAGLSIASWLTAPEYPIQNGNAFVAPSRSDSSSTNSSPPSRARVSSARSTLLSRSVTAISSWSPASWPCRSLTVLNPSRSRKQTAQLCRCDGCG